MNKIRELMYEDKKIETVKDRMARGSSLIPAELRVQFWMTENLCSSILVPGIIK
jgi:hypothetical protein